MTIQKNNRRSLFPIIILFTGLNIFFITGKNLLERNDFNQSVLIIGNLILFVVTLFSFLLNKRNLKATNPNAFVRGVYLSTMLKLFVCSIAACIYIFVFRSQLNKPALFTCMGLYFVYTFMEVSTLTKLLKEKKNA